MKRYNIDAPAKESPDGDWVEWVEVERLLAERNMAISALWRIAGCPVGAIDVSMSEKAEKRFMSLQETNSALRQRLEHAEVEYAKLARRQQPPEKERE